MTFLPMEVEEGKHRPFPLFVSVNFEGESIFSHFVLIINHRHSARVFCTWVSLTNFYTSWRSYSKCFQRVTDATILTADFTCLFPTGLSVSVSGSRGNCLKEGEGGMGT